MPIRSTCSVLGLLIAVMVAGHSTGGSRRWINLGVFNLEPSELAKIAVVLVMVRYLREEPPQGRMGPAPHDHPGPAAGGAGRARAEATRPRHRADPDSDHDHADFRWRSELATMLVLAVAGLLAAPVSWHYLKPYQRERLVSFINPQSDPLGSGYHIIQSEIAIGVGRRLGQGLPEGHSGAAEFPARADHRFYLCGVRRGVRLRGLDCLAGLYAS